MEQGNPAGNERTTFASGIKAAAVVVILGTLAAVTDLAFFASPHSAARPLDATPPAVAQAAPAAFTVPPELHPNASEVPAHIQAF